MIEPLKGNKVDFYEQLISDLTNELFINDVVISECLYYILGFSAGVSPRTLQQKKKIKDTLENESKIIRAINNFNFLSGNSDFILEVPRLMSTYNLLPNDAIILATCKLHETKLASHDSDFIIPCNLENIELLNSSNS